MGDKPLQDFKVQLTDGQDVEVKGVTITAETLPEIIVVSRLVFRLAIRDTADGTNVFNLVPNAVFLP